MPLTSQEILELLERRDSTALVYGDSICQAHNLLFTSYMVAGALEELFKHIDVVHLVKPVFNPGYPNHTHSSLLVLSHSEDSVIAVVTDDETRLSIGHGCYLSTLFEIPFETGRGIRRIVEEVDSRFCVIDYPERMVGILLSTLLSPLNSSGKSLERVELYLREGTELRLVESESRLDLLSKFQANLFDLSRASSFFATEPSIFDFSFAEKFRRIFDSGS